MSTTPTLVTYHYVRPLKSSRHPRIKGLELELFREQVSYFAKHYTPIAIDDLIAAARGRTPLPKAPILLTFDDGYRDHYEHVFPILRAHRMSGAFYPAAAATVDGRVLDVNKIHFVLASADEREVAAEIEKRVGQAVSRREIEAPPSIESFGAAKRDTGATLYVKRMLQVALPEAFRHALVGELFRRFVTEDERAFAAELYASPKEWREMLDGGMHVGSHGDKHGWLNHMSREDQARDLDGAERLFSAIGGARPPFTFCYPYGAYNADTLALLAERGCVAALTVKQGLARDFAKALLELPRLDTNDLPKDANAEPNAWTREVLA